MTSGTLAFGGRDVTHGSVVSAPKRGSRTFPRTVIAAASCSITPLPTISSLGINTSTRGARGAWALDEARIGSNAQEEIQRFDIRPPDRALPARALSGGNQQKIVIAREMGGAYDVLLASQPTRGVDVGAIEFIHAQLRSAREAGKAILLVSAERRRFLRARRSRRRMYGGQSSHAPAARRHRGRLGPLMNGRDRDDETGRVMTAAARRRVEEAVLPPLVALLVALVVGDILIILVGQSPSAVYQLMLGGTWANWYGFGQVLYKATTLICTGLAVSVALRAGLFNIGGEGQLAAGGFAAAVAGLLLPAGTPGVIAVPLCIAAALLAGGLVGAIPGVMKARFGAHEVIVTIMLNFIVLALLNWIVASHLHVHETLHTPEMRAGALPRLMDWLSPFHGSAVNASLFVAIAAAVIVGWILFRTRAGYELRAVGLQPDAAEYGGVRVGGVWMKAFIIRCAAGWGDQLVGVQAVKIRGGFRRRGFIGMRRVGTQSPRVW